MEHSRPFGHDNGQLVSSLGERAGLFETCHYSRSGGSSRNCRFDRDGEGSLHCGRKTVACEESPLARAIGKQVCSSPFQFSLSTNALRMFSKSLTDTNAETTVVSVDGVGACNLISRNKRAPRPSHVRARGPDSPFRASILWPPFNPH